MGDTTIVENTATTAADMANDTTTDMANDTTTDMANDTTTDMANDTTTAVVDAACDRADVIAECDDLLAPAVSMECEPEDADAITQELVDLPISPEFGAFVYFVTTAAISGEITRETSIVLLRKFYEHDTGSSLRVEHLHALFTHPLSKKYYEKIQANLDKREEISNVLNTVLEDDE